MTNAMIMQNMTGGNNVKLAPSSYSDVGGPLAQIYTTKQHGGHNQNWTTIQSSDGLVYVGHTQGISQWDGEHWHNFVTPHSTPVRSISQFKDDLYFGTTNDVFKLTINPAGELKATSLLDSLSDSGKPFGEIWSTASHALGVIFVASEHTFFYDGKRLSRLDAAISSQHFIFNVNGTFYFKPKHLPHLYTLAITQSTGDIQGKLNKFPFELPTKARVMEILMGVNNHLTIFTERHGVFQIQNNRLIPVRPPEYFGTDTQLYDVILSSDGFYYVGSTYSGIFVLDANFTIMRQYEESDGISMNTVFSVDEDMQGNIWLAGIPNVVKMRPPHVISQFKAGNASTEILDLAHTSRGFFATGNGQFRLVKPVQTTKTPAFKAMSASEESSVDLLEFDQTLIRAGRGGIFELILNQDATRVVRENLLIETNLGRTLGRDANGHLLVSASDGAFLLIKENNRWQVSAFSSAITQLTSLYLDKEDTLWLGSATSELFKLSHVSQAGISAPLQTFSKHDGLGFGPVSIFNINGNAIFSSAGKLLSFSENKLQEIDLPMFTPEWLASSKTIDALIQTPATGSSPERIWYRKNQKSGYFKQNASGIWQEHTAIFDAVETGGFNSLLIADNDILWFVRDKGEIYRVNIGLAEQLPATSPVNIRRLGSKNQLINFRNQTGSNIQLLPEQTDLRFSYASSDSSSPIPAKYRTQLSHNNAASWSQWSHETYRDFTQLSPNQYQLEVQAKDAWGRITTAQLNLQVIAPWYLTNTAYVLYVLLGFIGMFSFAYVVQKWRTQALELANHALEMKVEVRTKEVNEKVELLRQQQILKDRFFGNVSHEFRTPLTLTIGPLETLVTEHKSELSQEVSHLAKMALNNASKMLALVGLVLDMNRLEAGRLPLRIAQYDKAEFLRNITERFQIWAKQNNQNIQVIGCEEPFLLWFDMDQFDKCVSNLLSNAIKYSGENSVITVQLTNQGEDPEVRVLDNGVGISEGSKAKVFERFYQDESSVNASTPGTGIGLALVKEIMQLHHGDARLAEETNIGCCFILILKSGKQHFDQGLIIEPIALEGMSKLNDTDMSHADVFGETLENISKIKTKPFADQKNEDVTTLLIVDDNKELLNFISLRLSASYRILQANNGEEGYQKACSELPDLIISDVNMPIMTGLELTQKIKANQQTQTIPIILLTAKATKREVVSGFSVGADDYLTKPFDTSELIMRVNAQINARKLVRETLQAKQDPIVSTNQTFSFQDKVNHIIKLHLTDPEFNVEQLTTTLHMSRDTLIRKCKKECGDTPLNLIILKRMQKADELLGVNNMSVSEVAYACGFESLSYFSKCYKKHRGISPSEALNQ
jgi:signal transduction histidine kinase/DNA-binding response OmpR family regulator